MATQVSPGVYSREIDLSLYAPALSTTIFGVVGAAHKGPINELTYIGSIPEYVEAFGVPTTPMGYAAWSYLRQGRTLKVVRVGDGNEAKSAAILLDGTSSPTLTVRAVSEGVWADGIQVVTTAGSVSGVKLTVVEGGFAVESWDNVTKANYDLAVEGSKYIELADDYPANTNNPAAGNTVTLAAGDDGIAGLIDSDYVGTITGDTYTGLQMFSNPETVDLNLVACPGISSAAVVNALLSLASGRGDTFAIVDPPLGLTTQEVVDWHNGAGAWSGQHQAFNSSYGGLQWAWHQIYDSYTSQKVWIAPSGPTSAIYAYSDDNSEVWYAPAGLTRGRVANSLAIEHSPSQGQRDLLQGNSNAVNPYVNFSTDGITLWGQRTLQRAPTALDRVNVRRMLLYAEKVLATSARYLAFQPHDPITWRRLEVLAGTVLDPIQARRGIYSYRAICDESTNTSDLIDQNKMLAKIMIKPTKTAEVIQLDWNILSTGSAFTELI